MSTGVPPEIESTERSRMAAKDTRQARRDKK